MYSIILVVVVVVCDIFFVQACHVNWVPAAGWPIEGYVKGLVSKGKFSLKTFDTSNQVWLEFNTLLYQIPCSVKSNVIGVVFFESDLKPITLTEIKQKLKDQDFSKVVVYKRGVKWKITRYNPKNWEVLKFKKILAHELIGTVMEYMHIYFEISNANSVDNWIC